MKNYFSKGDRSFCMMMAYYLTWEKALELNTFSLREALFIVWMAVLNYVVVVVFFWIITRILKHSIFGQWRSQFFNWRWSLPASMGSAAIVGGFLYLTGEREMTLQRILTYAIGYVVGVGVFMLYSRSLVNK